MCEDRSFVVKTPLGNLKVSAKHDNDCPEDYPGVYIDYVRDDGSTTLLAIVEFNSSTKKIVTVVYADCATDEPTEIVEHYNTDFEE